MEYSFDESKYTYYISNPKDRISLASVVKIEISTRYVCR